jgi:hypothetical protein
MGEVITARPGANRQDAIGPSLRGSRRARRRVSQRLMLALALAVTLLVLFFVAMLYFSETGNLSRMNAVLRADLDRKELELDQLRPELEKTRQEFEQILNGRYPHLQRLELDQVLTLNKAHLKNIVFTVVRQGREKKYEYKLVMENGASREIRPDFALIVFDRLGVQIGSDEGAQLPVLAAGETRSYASAVALRVHGEPHYFYVNDSPSQLKSHRFAQENSSLSGKTLAAMFRK